MRIGVYKQNVAVDGRVALIPSAVHALREEDATVIVQSNAGKLAGFSDDEFRDAGAEIVYSREEIVKTSDVLLKISTITVDDCDLFKEEQIVFGFLHLAVSTSEVLQHVVSRKLTLVGYEVIEDEEGRHPILKPISDIGGKMSVQVAANLLRTDQGGRGILLGGIPGVPPANVVIIGAGNVGLNAAQSAIGLGAQVIVLDQDVEQLEGIERRLGTSAVTMLCNSYNLSKALAFADVAIGAVLQSGGRTPQVVSEATVARMKRGSVIVDVSIDQGGCFETSHPTTYENPTYEKHGVIHYCVPNITRGSARIFSIGLSNALLPFLIQMERLGFEKLLRLDQRIQKGTYAYKGKLTREAIARMFDQSYSPIEQALET